jgi:hypothetical protein
MSAATIQGAGFGPRFFYCSEHKALLTRHPIAAKIRHGKT